MMGKVSKKLVRRVPWWRCLTVTASEMADGFLSCLVKKGHIEEAMRYYTTALYFHPKDNNIIKSAIEKINEPDLEDEDDRL